MLLAACADLLNEVAPRSTTTPATTRLRRTFQSERKTTDRKVSYRALDLCFTCCADPAKRGGSPPPQQRPLHDRGVRDEPVRAAPAGRPGAATWRPGDENARGNHAQHPRRRGGERESTFMSPRFLLNMQNFGFRIISSVFAQPVECKKLLE